MIMRAGSFDRRLRNGVPSLDDATSGIHCGDIEDVMVFKTSNKINQRQVVYTLIKNQAVIGYFYVEPEQSTVIIEIAYVVKEVQRTGIFSMFLFFLKRNEGFDKIILGDIHSADTVEAVKRIVKRFKTSWVKGDEIRSYDETTIDNFYSHREQTGWKIVLENEADFSGWPKYFDKDSLDLTQLYEGFLD